MLAELEFRINALTNALNTIVGMLLALYFLNAMFNEVGSLGGWSLYQVLGLFGVALILEGLLEVWLFPSLHSLSEQVRTGDLDYLLVRPVDSQFLVSCSKISIWELPRVLIGGAVVIYAMSVESALGLGNLLAFLGLMIAGVTIFYSFFLITCTLSIWFVKIGDVWIISYTIMEIARFPVTAFPGSIRTVLTFLVPVYFVSNVPAAAAMGLVEWQAVVGAFLCALVSLCISRVFWLFALRSYSSASS
ncbi:ABC transporter permease [Pseudomonas oryzihabitans]|uniref:ABC transporter permease n=1 Tax=Pseudomonas oryzihabitans TaxID=47885 RepID=UPI0028571039|nr:ABC-2 family transporter protein [Pseudomonas psychrotolerans]MDR6676237.1 ABC-2 type transport system permease protein [Pseudomonas psychrotolerans]